MQENSSAMKWVFLFASRNKQKILTVFRTLYIGVFILWVTGFFLSVNGQYLPVLYNAALVFGRTALILFCIVITPGILKRLGKTWYIRTIIMLFRRQFGVLTFLVAFLHFSLMRLFPYLTGEPILRFPLLNFELFGLISLVLMSFLFITSNDFSVRKLGKWWNRIHKLVYVIAWTIALHVAFIRISIYSYLIITFAILETISLIYYYIPKKPVTPPPGNPTT